MWPADEVDSLAAMTRAGVKVVLSSAAMTGEQVLARFGNAPGIQTTVVDVTPAPGGRLSVTVT